MIHIDLFSPQPSPLSWAIHTPDLLTKRLGFISGPGSLVCVAAAGLLRSSRTQLCSGRVPGCTGRCCGPVAAAWKPCPSATVCASFCLPMFPFLHGWEFSQAPGAHQVFPPSVCCIRGGRIGSSADDLKVPPFPDQTPPIFIYERSLPGAGRGRGCFHQLLPSEGYFGESLEKVQGRFLILELVDWSWTTAMKSQKARMDRIRLCWRAEKGRLLRWGYCSEGQAGRGAWFSCGPSGRWGVHLGGGSIRKANLVNSNLDTVKGPHCQTTRSSVK